MLRLAWLPIAQHVFQPALTGRHELISQNIVSSEQEQRLSRWAGFAKNCLPLIQCKELPQFCEKYRALGRHRCKIREIDGQKNGVQHATAIYLIPRYTRSRYIGLTLYNKTLHTSLHWLKQGINHSLNPQNTSCTEAASSPLHLLWADEGDIKPEGKAVYCTGLEHCEGDGDLDIVKVVFVSTLKVHCVFVGPRHTDTDVKCVLQEKEWTDYKSASNTALEASFRDLGSICHQVITETHDPLFGVKLCSGECQNLTNEKSMDSGNVFMPTGNKHLPEPKWSKTYIIWSYLGTMTLSTWDHLRSATMTDAWSRLYSQYNMCLVSQVTYHNGLLEVF